MEKALASHLLQLVGAYSAACQLNESTVGRFCAADGRFFSRIREGKTFTVKKYDEVVVWFAVNWPAELCWPQGIDRPVIHQEAAE
ncbi:hypothetical protein [Rhizobium rhizophilum]|uniref:hypothetical protein n=1 Tax=Rhizobium rhizophilum TaxID=1850373 RepID=UPI00197E08BF|nr:hypothetical protein [Rhizobium rhizophilum]